MKAMRTINQNTWLIHPPIIHGPIIHGPIIPQPPVAKFTTITTKATAKTAPKVAPNHQLAFFFT